MKLTIQIFIVASLVFILGFDLYAHFTWHWTISQQLWEWSREGWGRLIPFSLGFLSCHLLLGKSGNG